MSSKIKKPIRCFSLPSFKKSQLRHCDTQYTFVFIRGMGKRTCRFHSGFSNAKDSRCLQRRRFSIRKYCRNLLYIILPAGAGGGGSCCSADTHKHVQLSALARWWQPGQRGGAGFSVTSAPCLHWLTHFGIIDSARAR